MTCTHFYFCAAFRVLFFPSSSLSPLPALAQPWFAEKILRIGAPRYHLDSPLPLLFPFLGVGVRLFSPAENLD